MAETLTLVSSDIESMDMETIRRSWFEFPANLIDMFVGISHLVYFLSSRFKQLSELRVGDVDSLSDATKFDPKNLLADCLLNFQRRMEQIDSEDQNIASLRPEDLGDYIEHLKKELHFAQDENVKLSSDISTLTKAISADTAQFGANLESLSFLLNVIDSQGQLLDDKDAPDDMGTPGFNDEGSSDPWEDHKFKILELSGQLAKSKSNLSTLEYLDFALKRVEAIRQIEELLSDVRVIDFEGNHIRLLLKTPIPSIDSFPLQYNLACSTEPSVVDHELMIEVSEKTMEPMNLEIFPADVYVDEIMQSAKSSRHISTMMISSYLGWLVRQVQKRILLCTIRRYLVRDANKSRHSFEYSDRGETITAHMVGGIDAFIKTSQGWPLPSGSLTLISMKSSDARSRSISLRFLCKVKDLANYLDTRIRCQLTNFIDAIEEILVREMRSELH